MKNKPKTDVYQETECLAGDEVVGGAGGREGVVGGKQKQTEIKLLFCNSYDIKKLLPLDNPEVPPIRGSSVFIFCVCLSEFFVIDNSCYS